MIRNIICLVFLSIMLMTVPAAASNSEDGKAAISAAQNWLAVVDAGKYVESWNDAAKYFKNAIMKEQWEQSLRAVRTPLGNLLSRVLQSKTFKTSLPGAPDGQYVVIQFKSSFENKKSAIETVTPMLDKDGIWRVSGYYIK
jgi:hypothetical protein